MKSSRDIKKHSAPRYDIQAGFSLLEALIVVAIVAILVAMSFLGVTQARASMRLSGAAREYASYIEKVRVYSIRRHADTIGQAASVAINEDRVSYTVTFDFDGDGTMETRTIQLPDGVAFQTVETIAFDWRGRTWNTVGGVTSAYAQVSITLSNGNDSASVDVTGSGDVTIDSSVFDDAVPNVTLNVGDLTSGATPPTPLEELPASDPPIPIDGVEEPAPTDPPTDPTDQPTEPQPIDETPLPDPDPPSATDPTPTPTPAATPMPTATPTPSVPCLITASPSSVTLSQDGTTSVVISHNSSNAVTISGVSSKASDLQVSAPQTVAANGTVTFTLKSKKSAGNYSVTFSASCGEVVVPVKVQ